MKFTRRSIISGITRTLDLPVTQEQFDHWRGGILIQRAMPHLTIAEREFILTGTSQEEWEAMMKEEEQ